MPGGLIIIWATGQNKIQLSLRCGEHDAGNLIGRVLLGNIEDIVDGVQKQVIGFI